MYLLLLSFPDAHAREWITSAVATFTVNELLSNEQQTNISRYLDDFDVYVLPFLNPDGFAFTHSGVSNAKCSKATFKKMF